MSIENTEPTEPQNEPQQPQEPPQEPGSAEPQNEPPEASGQNPNAEAARWRRALRAEEAKTASLAARLDEHDRREVERIAANRLQDPGDLWLATSLDEMRGEDGALDLERVGAELGRITKEKPHWTLPTPDLHQGAGKNPEPPPPSFGQSIKKALGG
jgi:hypothetical protein